MENTVDSRFAKYRAQPTRRLRNELVEAHLHVVDHHVRRFRNRGIDEEDLRQQALIALIGAVERFDPEYGVAFSTFAGRTVEGELKRHLRDRGWAVRPPRSLQELHLAVRRAEIELTQTLGRSPVAAELATAMEEPLDRILEALSVGGAYSSASLDTPAGALVAESMQSGESDTAPLLDRMQVAGILEQLDERDRQVLELRYLKGMTQPDIGEQLGVSQSYVSRVLRRALERARVVLEEQDEG